MGVDIVKVFSLNAVATLVRMIANVISMKVVATLIGPSGVALIGQLNNLNYILLGLGNGGINSGIVKYVSEFKEDKNALCIILSTALRVILICSFVIALFLVIGSSYLSRYILMSDSYGFVFVVFGLTIILYELNILLISIVNGHKQFHKYVVINIASTCIGLLFTVLLVLLWGVSGALISVVTYQSVVFFCTLYLCRGLSWFQWDYFKNRISKEALNRFSRYSVMTIVSLAMFPVVQIILRSYVITEISIEEAGWWEGMNRISNMYLSVITTSFGIYYLPRLSEISDYLELRKEIIRSYKFIIPLLLTLSLIIFLLRDFIIWILYSEKFYPMSQLFLWQLTGDFFKIASWLLAYLMHAKAMARLFIITEITFSITYLLLGYFFSIWNGILGLVQGYMVNYILYMFFMLFVFRKILFKTAKI